MKHASVTRLPNVAGREKWVERINAAWRESLPSIFETGNLLESAKAELIRGEWTVMVKEELPFSRMTAHMLMAIALNDNLRNVNHGLHLPVSWRTLYELTKLTDEQFEAGIKSRAINPKMERKDVNELRGIEPKERKKKDQELPHTSGEWISDLKSRLVKAAWSLQLSDLEQLFGHLRQHMDNLARDFRDRKPNGMIDAARST